MAIKTDSNYTVLSKKQLKKIRKAFTDHKALTATRIPFSELEVTHNPEPVIETYQIIERLLVGRPGELYEDSKTLSDTVMYCLHKLYEQGVINERNSHDC